MTIEDIATNLKNTEKNIIIIYAFNATGKTRLSVAYKDITKDSLTGHHTGVYYNAFSEDLFVWENDNENDGSDIRMNILQSSLNRFHSFLYENSAYLTDKLAMYSPTFTFKFEPHQNPEDGIKSIKFFANDNEDVPIKISRGEERIFVWCFFLALLEVDGWANEQNEHVFIDDPVSSLDEHNIFITADTIFQQIEQHYTQKKIIITTHHIGLFSILADRLIKGEKSGRYRNLTQLFIFKRHENDFELSPPRSEVFLFHLHILQVLDNASRGELYLHHIVLLRQALENISSFLGTSRISYVLEKIGIDNAETVTNTIHSLSHRDEYYNQSNLMNGDIETIFRDILAKLLNKYNFILHTGNR